MKNINLLASSALVLVSLVPPQRAFAMDDGDMEKSHLPARATSGTPFGDRIIQWIASYAEDLPSYMFAKSFQEIDYVNDPLFWQGNFYGKIKEIKKSRVFGVKERQDLKELQEIVWNGFLSPYAYEESLTDLATKERFSGAFPSFARKAFRSELQENPDTVLQHLRKELSSTLTEMQDNSVEMDASFFKDFSKKLSYYREVLNVVAYVEALGGLLAGSENIAEKLVLSEKKIVTTQAA